jgi:regulator of replication initiation timing
MSYKQVFCTKILYKRIYQVAKCGFHVLTNDRYPVKKAIPCMFCMKVLYVKFAYNTERGVIEA